MDPIQHRQLLMTRRSLLANGHRAIGGAALATLLGQEVGWAGTAAADFGQQVNGLRLGQHFAPRAELGDLPVHGRRALAHRHVRLPPGD